MFIDPSGKKSVRFLPPVGRLTDWESTIKIVVDGLRSIGVDVQEKSSYEQWDRDLRMVYSI